MAALDDAGFTSVVATNCDQHYVRPLVPGDHLEVTSVIDSVSAEKPPASGSATSSPTGSSSPTRTVSWWPPCCSASSSSGPGRRRPIPPGTPATAAARPKRPRPALTQDNRFFFEGRQGAQTAHPAVHRLRHAASPAPAGLRQLPLVRVGHGDCVGPGHHLQLRGQPLSAGPGVRLSAGGGLGGAGGGHPAGGQRRRHHPRDGGHRDAGDRRVRDIRRRADAAGLPSGVAAAPADDRARKS